MQFKKSFNIKRNVYDAKFKVQMNHYYNRAAAQFLLVIGPRKHFQVCTMAACF